MDHCTYSKLIDSWYYWNFNGNFYQLSDVTHRYQSHFLACGSRNYSNNHRIFSPAYLLEKIQEYFFIKKNSGTNILILAPQSLNLDGSCMLLPEIQEDNR